MIKTFKTFIIHLSRATERKANIERLQQNLPQPVEIIEAVDAKQLTQAEKDAVYKRKLIKPFYPFELSDSEIACFLSHRKAWQAIVDQKLDAALIIEDDIAVGDHFDKAVAFAKQNMTPLNFIRLPFRDREQGVSIVAQDDMRIIAPRPVGLNLQAQIIGYEAAQKLLDTTSVFDRPVDTTIQMFWHTNIRPLTLLPPAIKEISSELGGSTIQRKRKFADKLRREILRPLYRSRIAKKTMAHLRHDQNLQ